MDKFGDIKLDMASLLKREMAGVARVASTCNAFAIATISSMGGVLTPKTPVSLSGLCFSSQNAQQSIDGSRSIWIVRGRYGDEGNRKLDSGNGYRTFRFKMTPTHKTEHITIEL